MTPTDRGDIGDLDGLFKELDELTAENARLTQRVQEHKEAANWVLHVVCGIGKNGEPPCSEEADAAFDSLKKLVEAL